MPEDLNPAASVAPERDDANWTCNIVMREEGGKLSLRKQPVVQESEVAPEPPGVGSTAAVLENLNPVKR